MDRFIAKVRTETNGEIVGDLEIVRIPPDLYRARNATSLQVWRAGTGDRPFARSPVFLVGDSTMGSPYFQSISPGFECGMFLAGLLAQADLPLTDMLERYERLIYKQWLRVYMRTKMIKHNKDLFGASVIPSRCWRSCTSIERRAPWFPTARPSPCPSAALDRLPRAPAFEQVGRSKRDLLGRIQNSELFGAEHPRGKGAKLPERAVELHQGRAHEGEIEGPEEDRGPGSRQLVGIDDAEFRPGSAERSAPAQPTFLGATTGGCNLRGVTPTLPTPASVAPPAAPCPAGCAVQPTGP
jgi:hypothetical protein